MGIFEGCTLQSWFRYKKLLLKSTIVNLVAERIYKLDTIVKRNLGYKETYG